MKSQDSITLLTRLQNGITAPLFFDGQVIEAADLTLGRANHLAELMRLRQLLHGWGVVAGLAVTADKKDLIVQPGYGICPSGAELYLPHPVPLTDLLTTLRSCCAPPPSDCAIDAVKPQSSGPTTAWLVARPDRHNAGPRASWPSDCSHPGNALHFSRECGEVALELHCRCPDSHPGAASSDGESMRRLLCSGMPVPLPPPHPAPDLLVLARLRLQSNQLQIDYDGRRPLYSVSLLQDLLLACQCQPGGSATPPGYGSKPGTYIRGLGGDIGIGACRLFNEARRS